MKRRIRFNLSINSSDGYIDFIGRPHIASGGEWMDKEIEFDWEPSEGDSFKKAVNVLREQMNKQKYHIWYWTWLE